MKLATLVHVATLWHKQRATRLFLGQSDMVRIVKNWNYARSFDGADLTITKDSKQTTTTVLRVKHGLFIGFIDFAQ